MMRFIPIATLVLGLATLYPMQRWIDTTSPRELISEESLFFTSGEALKKMSIGFDALVADIYWIRTVQYFGRKIIDEGEGVSAGSSRNIRMELLAPLLRIVVTLDPKHIPAYRFGAIFLPERDLAAAIELLESGIQANPDEWRLYQDLAYIYWQAGRYEEAAEWYDRGSRIEGAAWWMRDMAGVMKIKGGSRDVARAIYEGYYNESDDPMIRAQAIDRLNQLRALDEIDAINGVLAQLKQKYGACPASLRRLAPGLQAMGLTINEEMQPVDPAGFPYEFDSSTCTVSLSPKSSVPR